MNEDVVRVELTDIARTALAPRAELVLPRLIVSRGTSPRHRRPSSRHRYRVTPALVSPSSMRASVLLHRCTQEYHGPPSEYKGYLKSALDSDGLEEVGDTGAGLVGIDLGEADAGVVYFDATSFGTAA